MTSQSKLGLLLTSGAFLFNLLTSCETVEGCEYTGSCPGGAGGVESGGRGGAAAGTAGASTTFGGRLGAGGGTVGGSAGSGDMADAGSGGAAEAGAAGARSVSGGSAGAGGATGSDAGAPSNAGAGGSLPCDGACADDTPVCDETTQLCVECLSADDCSAKAPACDPMAKRCVECLSDSHCGATAPGCDIETQTCVACTRDQHCPSQTPLCDVQANTCVACLDSTHCTNAGASRCDAGTCMPCSAASDCAHISGKGLCDAGQCVQCTSANEAPCAGKSCNPANRRCTSTAVHSLGLCQACVADSECIGNDLADPDARCVPLEFAGEKLPGGFCLRRATKTCSRPFSSSVARASLSGAAVESYCGIDQASTRCPAVLDLIAGRTCDAGQDAECGCSRDADGNCTVPGEGALCRTVGALARSCTYSCGTIAQCPNGTTCTADIPYCH